MASVVADTHALVWYILEPERLSLNALTAFEQAAANGDLVYSSAISIVEICYLVERGRLPETVLRRLIDALRDPDAGVVVTPVDLNIGLAIQLINRDAIPDMPDRIIAATAIHLELPLVTRDQRIWAAGINTIW